MKKERDSNNELLRIIIIFFIVLMHTTDDYVSTCTDYLEINLVTSALGQLGVKCFMLISGYYGMKLKKEKAVNLHSYIFIFAVVDLGLKCFLNLHVGLHDISSGIFPVVTQKYWFFSVYFLIYILSPYIEKLVNSLSKKQFITLITIMVFLLSVCPSILFFNDSYTNNIDWLFTVYLIGIYIRKYEIKLKAGYCILGFLICQGLTIGIAYVFAIRQGRNVPGMMFANNNIIMLAACIFLFLLFKNIKIQSKGINVLSKGVFCVYLLNSNWRDFYNIDSLQGFVNTNIMNQTIIRILLISFITFVVGIALYYILKPIISIMDRITLIIINPITDIINRKIDKVVSGKNEDYEGYE